MIYRVVRVACRVSGGGISTGVIVTVKHIERKTPAGSRVLIVRFNNIRAKSARGGYYARLSESGVATWSIA